MRPARRTGDQAGGAGLSRKGRAGRVPGDSRHARKDGELGGLRGGDRFVRRASQGDVPGALTRAVARGTGREGRAAGLHRGRKRLAALDLAGSRRLRGKAGAHSLGPKGDRVPEEGTGAVEGGAS